MIWTNAALPETIGVWRLAGKVQKTLLPAKDVSLAGDYLFFGMVRDLDARSDPRVNILDAGSGKYVGVMVAGAAVGNYGGWEDMVGSVHATERTDGEYLVLVVRGYACEESPLSLAACSSEPAMTDCDLRSATA